MNITRLIAVILGGLIGFVSGAAATIYTWDWMTNAKKEDFTSGLIALVIGAPAGTLAGVLLTGMCYDRLVPAPSDQGPKQ